MADIMRSYTRLYIGLSASGAPPVSSHKHSQQSSNLVNSFSKAIHGLVNLSHN